jgi:hypothetical protein
VFPVRYGLNSYILPRFSSRLQSSVCVNQEIEIRQSFQQHIKKSDCTRYPYQKDKRGLPGDFPNGVIFFAPPPHFLSSSPSRLQSCD